MRSDVAIGLAVHDKSVATAYAGLRRGGRLVLVALPACSMRTEVPAIEDVRYCLGPTTSD
jgi:hypothetical protein